MNPDLPAVLFREAMLLLGTVGAPLFGALLVAGLAMGIMQAATQINDPAVGALPRLAAGAAVAFLLGGWMMERLSGFLASCLARIADRPF